MPRVRDWEPRFLESLSAHCNVSQACRDAGVTRTTVYRRRDNLSAFAAKWDDAIETALDAIEIAVYTESLKGDMQTARWFLSRRRPQVYGDRMALEHSGKDGGPIQADTQVVVDGLSDPAIRNALKVLALGLEGDAGDDGKEVV